MGYWKNWNLENIFSAMIHYLLILKIIYTDHTVGNVTYCLMLIHYSIMYMLLWYYGIMYMLLRFTIKLVCRILRIQQKSAYHMSAKNVCNLTFNLLTTRKLDEMYNFRNSSSISG